MPAIFITGIDTASGKTYAAGMLARYLLEKGKSVITQKIVQTGCERVSEDIILHRKIMGIDLQEDDKRGLTCPYLFKFPASPHLAARIEKSEIDLNRIKRSTEELSKKYEYVLIEGAGGFHVPLKKNFTIIDYIEREKYPVIIVTAAKLGSINHTLLTLETSAYRKINILGLIYNQFPEEKPEIANDTKTIFMEYLKKFSFRQIIIDMPRFGINRVPEISFENFFM